MGVFVRRGKRGSKTYIDYYVGEKRVRECLGNVPRKLAEDALKLRQAEIIKGQYQFKPKCKPITFVELCKDFREYLASRKEGNALRAYESRLLHLEPAFSKMRLSEVSPFHVERYIRQRKAAVSYRKRPISPTTVNRELAVLKRMFNLAIKWRKAEGNPVCEVKFLKEERPPERTLSEDEEEELRSRCAPHVRLVVLFALHAGMRLGEILNLRWQDIDFRQKALTVVRSKSGKVRSIPINSVLFEAICAFRRDGVKGKANGQGAQDARGPRSTLEACAPRYLFYNDRTGKPMQDTKTGFQRAVRRAGIQHIRFHDLRHTFATRLVTRGVDLATVSQLLGHASIEMTMRYAHPSPENRRRAVEMLCDGHYLDTSSKFTAQADSAKLLNSHLARP